MNSTFEIHILPNNNSASFLFGIGIETAVLCTFVANLKMSWFTYSIQKVFTSKISLSRKLSLFPTLPPLSYPLKHPDISQTPIPFLAMSRFWKRLVKTPPLHWIHLGSWWLNWIYLENDHFSWMSLYETKKGWHVWVVWLLTELQLPSLLTACKETNM